MSNEPRTALVTGGTDGIGKEVARGLASEDHRVLIVGSDPEKGRRAEDELRASTDNHSVHFLQADLSLVRECRRLARQVRALAPELHCLVHSAGIVRGRHVMTSEGVESNLAVNYLQRFVLTHELLPSLRAAGQPGRAARIVVVGGAARNGTIQFDDPNLMRGFSTLRAVGQFCRANDVFTVELAHRLVEKDPRPRVSITCLKIGVVKTGIRKEFPTWMKLLVPLLDPFLAQTPVEAADAALKLLLSDEYEGTTGTLFLKIKRLKRIDADHDARAQGRRLWQLTEELLQSTPDDRSDASTNAVTASAPVRSS